MLFIKSDYLLNKDGYENDNDNAVEPLEKKEISNYKHIALLKFQLFLLFFGLFLLRLFFN
jgi:hypothetical protein